MSVPSYGSLFAIGHRMVADIFRDPVVVQEKIDGSQFSFHIREDGVECRSKGAQLNMVAPDKMFAAGVAAVQAVSGLLTPGPVYRGEYLQRPKHNALAYDRVPANHVALFDVEDRNKGEGYYLTPDEVAAEAARLGFDVVPTIYTGMVETPEEIRAFLDRVSTLGGCKVEGVVVKNYARFGEDKKPLMGKFVSEAFKEVHGGEWRKANPTRTDVVASIIAAHRTPARFAKAVQHLREAGQLTDSPRDIGALIAEVGKDIEKECADDIRDALYAHFWPQIRRQVTGGLPEWYKDELLKASFEREDEREAA